jgi:hypothetical protein
VPTADSASEEFDTFADSLQSIMITHRNVGHDWDLTHEQIECLDHYCAATRLLVDCLYLTYVPDRQAIADTLLLPPGEWSLDRPAEKE